MDEEIVLEALRNDDMAWEFVGEDARRNVKLLREAFRHLDESHEESQAHEWEMEPQVADVHVKTALSMACDLTGQHERDKIRLGALRAMCPDDSILEGLVAVGGQRFSRPSDVEKEAYTIFKSIKHFRPFLLKTHTKVIVPFPAVINLLVQKDVGEKKANWVMALQ